jgi:hypothetical protein
MIYMGVPKKCGKQEINNSSLLFMDKEHKDKLYVFAGFLRST